MAYLDYYKDDDYIAAFLLGQLSDKEAALFTAAIEQNPELKSLVEEHKKYIKAIENQAMSEIHQRIKNVEEKLEEEGFFVTDEEIDDFLMGRLPMSRTREIEFLSIKEASLQERITTRHCLLTAIETAGEVSLRKELQAVEKTLSQEGFFEQFDKKKTDNKKVFRLPITRLSIAASVLLILTISLFWIFLPSNKQLPYAQYFGPIEEELSIKIEAELSEQGFANRHSEDLKKLQEGLNYYKNQQYQSAIPLLKAYIKAQPMAEEITEIQLYLGVAQLALQSPKEALPYLLAAQAAQAPAHIANSVHWYLALCYLQMDKKAEALPLLQSLEHSNRYGEKAKKIIVQIQ